MCLKKKCSYDLKWNGYKIFPWSGKERNGSWLKEREEKGKEEREIKERMEKKTNWVGCEMKGKRKKKKRKRRKIRNSSFHLFSQMSAFFSELEDRLEYSIGKVRTIKFAIYIILATHLCACLWFFESCYGERWVEMSAVMSAVCVQLLLTPPPWGKMLYIFTNLWACLWFFESCIWEMLAVRVLYNCVLPPPLRVKM